MAMTLNQKEIRAWAWWLLAVVALLAALQYWRYEPFGSSEGGTGYLWDRLAQQYCLVSVQGFRCTEYDRKTSVARPPAP